MTPTSNVFPKSIAIPPPLQKLVGEFSCFSQGDLAARRNFKLGEAKRGGGGFQTGRFPICSAKVLIVSWTLWGLFLVGAFHKYSRPRKGKRQKGTKTDQKGRTSPDREAPPFETPPSTGV